MTVKELREKINTLDPELEVFLEGCDCTNPWNGTLSIDEKSVTLEIEASYL
jgi:hypothetical protein